MRKLMIIAIAVVGLGGCGTAKKTLPTQARDPYSIDRLSTHDRLQEAQPAIESRARMYEAEGRSPKEARALAEAEYLRSSAGSPTRP